MIDIKKLFGHKGTQYAFDPARQEPAIRVSICTGEKTAGFIDKKTEHFTDDHLIASEQELDNFCRACGTTPERIRKIY